MHLHGFCCLVLVQQTSHRGVLPMHKQASWLGLLHQMVTLEEIVGGPAGLTSAKTLLQLVTCPAMQVGLTFSILARSVSTMRFLLDSSAYSASALSNICMTCSQPRSSEHSRAWTAADSPAGQTAESTCCAHR